MQVCGRVFRYAIATGRATRDITRDLLGALAPVQAQHMPTLTDPRAVGELMRAIHGYEGTIVVRCALRLAPLTLVRPGELRKAEWSELYLDDAEWRIAAHRMKMRRSAPIVNHNLVLSGVDRQVGLL
jgi:integrase